MTRDELNKNLCAIITTLDEVPFAQESYLYMSMGMDMSKWETVKQVLVAGNLATFHGFSAYITPAGHAMAETVKQVLVAGNLATFHGFSAYITPAGHAMASKIKAAMR